MLADDARLQRRSICELSIEGALSNTIERKFAEWPMVRQSWERERQYELFSGSFPCVGRCKSTGAA